jgi:hypothetical protein
MLTDQEATERIPGYCALCISRCGSIAVGENGHFVALEPDPSRWSVRGPARSWRSATVDSDLGQAHAVLRE